ncbi:Serine/threonine-protein phosphatase 2A regulatory subunit B'' subunit gamma [Rhizophlyctis rosea]|nr:Serine/threonine-protein phosphatase 2A regulatory subunit B'' subunit gamma [Rhizophlyctis rosea]
MQQAVDALEEALGDFVFSAPSPTPSEAAEAEEGHFRDLLDEQRRKERAQGGIPRFYFKKTADPADDPVSAALTAASYEQFLEHQAEQLLSNEELDVLWDFLCERSSDGNDEDRRIAFVDFEIVSSMLPDKLQSFFKPSTFLHFAPDDEGRIPVLQFFNYVLRKVSLLQARLDMSAYDGDHDGFLTEDEMQDYVSDLIPSLNLQNLNESFYKFYICTAVRKFIFFLDPMRRGKISIQTILLSPILTEMFELRENELSRDYERTNWFSAYSSLRIYGQFLNMDLDRNGMLSRSELAGYSNGTLTGVFLDRVFQEYQTYGGQMDYKAFLDFVLAMENIQTPEAIAYCFRLLDIKGQGFLDEFTVSYFFKAVLEAMDAMGQEVVDVADVTNEIFDMAHPKDTSIITLQDLLECGVGGTIVNILSDTRGFWAYDNREMGGDGSK